NRGPVPWTPPPRPLSPRPPDPDVQVRDLMKAGKFAEAEYLLRGLLAQSTGLRSAEQRLQLGICLVERAKGSEPADASSLRSEAAGNFGMAIKELDAAEKDGGKDKHAEWIRTQAEVRTLQALHQQGRSEELLKAAGPLVDKHQKTVDGLIILSLMYHAFKQ